MTDSDTEERRAARAHQVAQAIALGRLEGDEPSPDFRTDADNYINGRIDDAEFIARGRRLWGLPD